MGHLAISKSHVYRALAERLEKNPVGVLINETLMEILYRLYTETEAEIGSKFPISFAPLEKIAQITGMPGEILEQHLEDMAQKGLIIDTFRDGNRYYFLSPMAIGFMEYTFMRVTDKVPMQELAELFEEYHQAPGATEAFFGAETKLFHTWPYESMIPADVETEVLNYEKASAMIRDAGAGGLSMCYCRHQAEHVGKNCSAPIKDVCMSLGRAAEWLIRRNFARPASVDELLRVLDQTEEQGLMHLADNVQNNPAYLCHCCGCCCGVLRAINRHGIKGAHPSGFMAVVAEAKCTGCGACVNRCHVKAILLAGRDNHTFAEVARDLCLGCGACIRACPHEALGFVRRETLYVPPINKREQMLQIAVQNNKLR
ncbi:MAG: 4Fe-4S dicluster domain-containing protein [Syntrophomonadaceae bacterium]|nr:4Fe-4S dicluster domain-containing protein [Syntrophomonadaceae bacterium]